ncbi:MAG: hypothetical protein Fur0022_03590 [Anaerolineales bacterium]
MAYAQGTIHTLYKKLLGLYPQGFRERLGESMEQTFNDLWQEQERENGSLFKFVFWTFAETAKGVVEEHALALAQGDHMKNLATNPNSAALAGFLFALPFVVMNAMVGNQFEPFLSFIRPDTHTSSLEYRLLAVVLLLLPIGAFVAVRPMLQVTEKGKRKWYILNLSLAIVLFVGFVLITIGLGTDIYRCEILQIPKCD